MGQVQAPVDPEGTNDLSEVDLHARHVRQPKVCRPADTATQRSSPDRAANDSRPPSSQPSSCSLASPRTQEETYYAQLAREANGTHLKLIKLRELNEKLSYEIHPQI